MFIHISYILMTTPVTCFTILIDADPARLHHSRCTQKMEAEILGVERTTVYKQCTNKACFGTKLQDNKCPKCDRTTSTTGVVCKLFTQQGEEHDSLTLFAPQLQTIISPNPLHLDQELSADEVETTVLSCLPVSIKYTPSPKKDKTATSVRVKPY